MDDSNWEHRRKRARFRSWHRGMREMDLILGPFADAHAGALTPEELEQYEAFLDLNDADLLGWITGGRASRPASSAPEWALPLIGRLRERLATQNHP
ncbi:MAG: succinate dehydrogenase assembly factor 2 [Mesorhizobium amorphae]|nr:MAG: succinate dehydrogenase assembly factor 2 [Mesorhizobium amorphae]